MIKKEMKKRMSYAKNHHSLEMCFFFSGCTIIDIRLWACRKILLYASIIKIQLYSRVCHLFSSIVEMKKNFHM